MQPWQCPGFPARVRLRFPSRLNSTQVPPAAGRPGGICVIALSWIALWSDRTPCRSFCVPWRGVMHYRNSRVGWAPGLVAKVTGDLADPREFAVVPAGAARQAGTALSDYARVEYQTLGILKCHKFASFKHMIGNTFHQRSFGLVLPFDVTKGNYWRSPGDLRSNGHFRSALRTRRNRQPVNAQNGSDDLHAVPPSSHGQANRCIGSTRCQIGLSGSWTWSDWISRYSWPGSRPPGFNSMSNPGNSVRIRRTSRIRQAGLDVSAFFSQHFRNRS